MLSAILKIRLQSVEVRTAGGQDWQKRGLRSIVGIVSASLVTARENACGGAEFRLPLMSGQIKPSPEAARPPAGWRRCDIAGRPDCVAANAPARRAGPCRANPS